MSKPMMTPRWLIDDLFRVIRAQLTGVGPDAPLNPMPDTAVSTGSRRSASPASADTAAGGTTPDPLDGDR